MWVEEKGTSADPADTSIVAAAGVGSRCRTPSNPGVWVSVEASVRGCSTVILTDADDNLKLLTRTATNTYFPQVYTIISLPSEEDELTILVDELSWDLTGVQSVPRRCAGKAFQS